MPLTFSERVKQIREDIVAQRRRKYRDMIELADKLEARGDVNAARFLRRSAEEYAATRLGPEYV